MSRFAGMTDAEIARQVLEERKAALQPVDDEVVIEVESLADRQGAQAFTARWRNARGAVQAQTFYTTLSTVLTGITRRSRRVRVIAFI